MYSGHASASARCRSPPPSGTRNFASAFSALALSVVPVERLSRRPFQPTRRVHVPFFSCWRFPVPLLRAICNLLSYWFNLALPDILPTQRKCKLLLVENRSDLFSTIALLDWGLCGAPAYAMRRSSAPRPLRRFPFLIRGECARKYRCPVYLITRIPYSAKCESVVITGKSLSCADAMINLSAGSL